MSEYLWWGCLLGLFWTKVTLIKGSHIIILFLFLFLDFYFFRFSGKVSIHIGYKSNIVYGSLKKFCS